MLLSIIIVNYNTKGLLEDCITSIRKSIKEIKHEIIVVDNASKDGSVEMLKEKYPEVKIIDNTYNAGFAKANNQGYSVSTGKYILLLNSDTVVLNQALDRLIAFIEKHDEAAIVGPKLLNSDMTLQLPCRRGFPRLMNSMAYFTGLSKLFPKSRVLGSYLMTYIDSEKDHEVDAVSGACLLIRRSCIEEIGGLLDEDFFMHFEDIDLCYRTKSKGYKVFYCHEAEVIHLKGQSSKLRSEGVVRNFYDSAFLYFRKNYKAENAIAYFILMFIIIVMRGIALTILKVKRILKEG
jgi:GT2 family glycosyltransferase